MALAAAAAAAALAALASQVSPPSIDIVSIGGIRITWRLEAKPLIKDVDRMMITGNGRRHQSPDVY